MLVFIVLSVIYFLFIKYFFYFIFLILEILILFFSSFFIGSFVYKKFNNKGLGRLPRYVERTEKFATSGTMVEMWVVEDYYGEYVFDQECIYIYIYYIYERKAVEFKKQGYLNLR